MIFFETKRLLLRNVMSNDVYVMFDYRNNGEDADWGNAKDAIERATAFFDGTLPDRIRIK